MRITYTLCTRWCLYNISGECNLFSFSNKNVRLPGFHACWMLLNMYINIKKKKTFSKNWQDNNPKIIRDFYGGILSEDLLYFVKNKKCCPAVCLNSKHF